MKHIFLAVGLFFSLGASYALANITVVDPSPSPKPFGFFCEPYTHPFTSNYHYKDLEGFCTFNIPLSGNVVVGLYRGIPENSEPIGIDTNFSAGRVVQLSPISVTDPQDDEDFFGVIYDSSLGTQFDDYLRHGTTPPSEATLGTNYFILPWKWGPKPAAEFEPLVIIPGILGSWQKDNDWVIDPILHTYDNLIDTLEANGYVLGQTLFPFPYDWERSNTLTAFELKEKIEDIKSICNCSHVDIVAHSMGGLIAREYAESDYYQNDIDQLIFLATPHLGAPYAYKIWEGGDIDTDNPSPLEKIYDTLAKRIYSNEARDSGFDNIFDFIRNKPVSSVQELLPIVDYLIESVEFLSYPNGYPQNTFLENLDNPENVNLLFSRGIRLYNVMADTGDVTPTAYHIAPSNELPKWEHGKPTSTFFSYGDGRVPRESIENIFLVDQVFGDTDHTLVASTSAAYVFKTLTNEDPQIIVGRIYSKFDADFKLLFIKLLSPIDMQIIAPDGKRLGKDFDSNIELNEIPDAFYSGFNTEDEYAVIVDPLPGEYKVKTKGTGSGGAYTIVADYIDAQGFVEAETSGNTNPAQEIEHSLTLSITDRTIEIEIESAPTDTEPPVITITAPQANKTYTRLDTVSIVATVADASPLATTTYWFNGEKVNSTIPLPFKTTALGSSTVSVSATDSFGNAATSSVVFRLGATPASCAADMARAYQNKWVTKKAVYDLLVFDCKALGVLFQKRAELMKNPSKNKAKLAANTLEVKLILAGMELLAKDKGNTKEGVSLIKENILWLRDHELK